MSIQSQSDARRAYLVSKASKQAIAEREKGKAKPKPVTEKAPQPKVQK